MKRNTLLVLGALCMTIAGTSVAATTAGGHKHEHGVEAAKLQLNAGKKWETDDALRKGMSSMRASIATALPAAHAGKLSNAEYEALGKELGSQVAYIVQNCKLDPKADAQLHLVVADIVNGVDTIEGKQHNKKRAMGVVKVAQALNTYGKYFDHDGWQPVKLPH